MLRLPGTDFLEVLDCPVMPGYDPIKYLPIKAPATRARRTTFVVIEGFDHGLGHIVDQPSIAVRIGDQNRIGISRAVSLSLDGSFRLLSVACPERLTTNHFGRASRQSCYRAGKSSKGPEKASGHTIEVDDNAALSSFSNEFNPCCARKKRSAPPAPHSISTSRRSAPAHNPACQQWPSPRSDAAGV